MQKGLRSSVDPDLEKESFEPRVLIFKHFGPDWLRPAGRMSYRLVALLTCAFYLAATSMLTTTSEFLYFQF